MTIANTGIPDVHIFVYLGAGISAITVVGLMGILVWLIRRLLIVIAQTNDVLSKNTEVINTVIRRVHDQIEIMLDVQKQLYARPCIKDIPLVDETKKTKH